MSNNKKDPQVLVTFEDGKTRIYNAKTLNDFATIEPRCKATGCIMMPDIKDGGKMKRVVDYKPVPEGLAARENAI